MILHYYYSHVVVMRILHSYVGVDVKFNYQLILLCTHCLQNVYIIYNTYVLVIELVNAVR